MATYTEWNQALVTYFVEGLPKGSAVFLNADDDAIRTVGTVLADRLTYSDPLQDFLEAVRKKTVQLQTSLSARSFRQDAKYSIELAPIMGTHSNGMPKCVAFLSAMVLAATRMADDEVAAGHNYFRRFCELLQVTGGNPRPHGFERGSEEALWERWNRFLEQSSLVPTADRGESNYDKFIAYPISQALLRGTDRHRLVRLFRDRNWTFPMDPDMLIHRVKLESARLGQHLQSALEQGDQSRFSGLADAIHELHTVWRASPDSFESGQSGGVRPSTITCGLRRYSDPVWGDVSYFLYPRAARHRLVSKISVRVDEESSFGCDAENYTLFMERPGWMQPSIPATKRTLEEGAQFPIGDPAGLGHLAVPARDFWILVPDPDDPESGSLATWSHPHLGGQFLVLCKEKILLQVEALKREGVLEFNTPTELTSMPGWYEVPDCMILSTEWNSLFVESRELLDALRPVSPIQISLEGGLSDGSGNWIEGYGPRLTVFGFDVMAQVTVTDGAGTVMFSDTVEPNAPLMVSWPVAGVFRVDVKARSGNTSRHICIRSWNELRSRPNAFRHQLVLGSVRVCGAVISMEGSNQ